MEVEHGDWKEGGSRCGKSRCGRSVDAGSEEWVLEGNGRGVEIGLEVTKTVEVTVENRSREREDVDPRNGKGYRCL